MSELREVWKCASCSVTSRRPAEGAVPMPERWDVFEGQPRCVACQRGARGTVSASAGTKARKLEAAQQMDMIREAVRDHPDPGTNEALKEIADVVGCSVQKVRMARKQLADRGEVAAQVEPEPSQSVSVSLEGDLGRRVVGALQADHKRTNAAISQETEASEQFVGRVRKKLGLAAWDRHEAIREATVAALARLGESTIPAVADALGMDKEKARQRLDNLAKKGYIGKRTDPALLGPKGKPVPLYRALDA